MKKIGKAKIEKNGIKSIFTIEQLIEEDKKGVDVNGVYKLYCTTCEGNTELTYVSMQKKESSYLRTCADKEHDENCPIEKDKTTSTTKKTKEKPPKAVIERIFRDLTREKTNNSSKGDQEFDEQNEKKPKNDTEDIKSISRRNYNKSQSQFANLTDEYLLKIESENTLLVLFGNVNIKEVEKTPSCKRFQISLNNNNNYNKDVYLLINNKYEYKFIDKIKELNGNKNLFISCNVVNHKNRVHFYVNLNDMIETY